MPYEILTTRFACHVCRRAYEDWDDAVTCEKHRPDGDPSYLVGKRIRSKHHTNCGSALVKSAKIGGGTIAGEHSWLLTLDGYIGPEWKMEEWLRGADCMIEWWPDPVMSPLANWDGKCGIEVVE